jgi:hypothetical protein
MLFYGGIIGYDELSAKIDEKMSNDNLFES